MQKEMEEIVTSLQDSSYCYICNTDIQNENYPAIHYSSKSHKKKVKLYQQKTLEILELNKSTEILTSTIVTKSEIFQCNICDVRFDINTAAHHYQQDEHKKKEEAYCTVCNILTMSKAQLWSHMQGAKHNKKLKECGLPAIDEQYSSFDLTLSSTLKKMMQVEICEVCSVQLSTMKKALNHYKSPKHKACVRHWFKEKRQKEKVGCPDETDEITSASAKNVEQRTASEKMVDYYCFACKMNINVPLAQDNHRTEFPHPVLVKLKSGMVNKGITEEFWLHQNGSILCKLCNVQVCTVLEANEHFESTSHRLSFYIWCQTLNTPEVPSEMDVKLFYCKICDKALDCTESKKHDLSRSHLKKSQLYCKICDVRNSTQEMLEIHYTTALHKENLSKTGNFVLENGVKENTMVPMPPWYRNDSEIQNVQKSVVVEALQSKKNLPEVLVNTNSKLSTSLEDIEVTSSKNTTAVKEQVFQEIEKLVRTLYYSKTVPYDVALKFLKKINEEVEDLKSKYENKGRDIPKEGPVCSRSDFINNKEFDKNSSYEASFEKVSPNAEDASNEDKYFISTKEVQPAPDVIDFSNNLLQEDGNIPDKAQHNVNAVDDFDYKGILDSNFTNNNVIVSSACKKLKKAKYRKPDHIDQAESLPQSGSTLESMIEEIHLLTNEVEEKYPGENSIEKEVLTEIERLITLINSDCIPPEETLRCLEKFNRELDLECFGAEAKGNDWYEVDEDFKTEKEKAEVTRRYSKEDLMALRTK